MPTATRLLHERLDTVLKELLLEPMQVFPGILVVGIDRDPL
jgi:hypothetical protein